MSWKQITKDYLSFSRKDRIGLLCLIFLIGIIYGLPYFFSKKSELPFIKAEDTTLKITDSIYNQDKQVTHSPKSLEAVFDFDREAAPTTNHAKIELFTFDPNTLSAEGWQKLGLNNRIIKIIFHYRSKGGKFYKPEDVKKIWGLPEEFYSRVKDYIHITSNTSFSTTPTYVKFEKEVKKPAFININEADTSAFIALPGIGSKLANRIINFREKLGGFYSLDQVGETYGLPDSTFQKLKDRLQVNEKEIRKININTATKDELKMHPYIRWNLANAIVEYRNQHGAFNAVEELKNIMVIDEAVFSRIAPYIVVQ